MMRYHVPTTSVLAIFFLLSLSIHAQQSSTPLATGSKALTNADVLKMVEGKLSDDLIVSKVRVSACGFDTSTDTILKLKSQGVSDAVIEAMVNCGKPVVQPSATAAPPADPNNPLSPHSPGIYLLTKSQGGNRLTRLEASSYQGSKSSGVFSSGMSMGFKKAKWKAELAGAHATLRTLDSSPVFWFYFEDAAQSFGHGGPMGQVSKPEDFALARMEDHKNDRELVVGQASAFGNSTGLRSKDIVAVDVQEISPGIYKVTLSMALEPGEYCFVPPGSAAAFGMAGGQLYDFGVDKP